MTFSTEIIKIFDDLSKRLGVAIDWSNENIIPYLNGLVARFIQWQIATSIITIVIGIAMGVFGICMVKRIWKNREKYRYFGDMDEGITWAFIGTLACVVVGITLVTCSSYSISGAIFLPEMKIYNYVQNLITQ